LLLKLGSKMREMSTAHTFGGDWTQEKLRRVRGYLEGYAKIFDRNERAQWFETFYVDAFAGTGHRCNKPAAAQDDSLFEELIEPQTTEFLLGSASIALSITPGFKNYLFIERSPERVKELEAMREGHPRAERIHIQQGDANERLLKWCRAMDWQKTRAVVFLDPYGMQVDWSTIDELGATRGIDLWLLFPLGMAVMRLLTKAPRPPPEWEKALTRIYGEDSWRERFYVPTGQSSIFPDDEEELVRNADWRAVAAYTVERLETVFHSVHPKPYPLFNSRKIPLYLLCFAAGNAKGAPTAMNIASHLLKS
jgi:three-Cys-motif partner protein